MIPAPFFWFLISSLALAFAARSKMAVGAVEHRVGGGGPGRIRRQRVAAGVDAAAAHFAFGRFLLAHWRQREVARHRQHQNLQHRFARAKNVRAPFGRRFEHHEGDHRPPFGPQQRRHRDRHRIGEVGVEAGMRLGPHRPFRTDFQIEQQLIGVKVLAEAAEWRPLQIRRRAAGRNRRRRSVRRLACGRAARCRTDRRSRCRTARPR